MLVQATLTHRISYYASSKKVRRPGIEPGSTAWKATMLTITPATLLVIIATKPPCCSETKSSKTGN
jgi:hypothetical protein